MKQRILLAFMAFCIGIVLVGCTKKVDDVGTEPAETPEETEGGMDSEEEFDEEDEIEIIKPAENLGAMEIELTGTASIDGKVLKVDGQTNLLEGSKLTLKLDWAEGTLIGGSRTAMVGSDGSFAYETELPEKVSGLVTLELNFEPAQQNDDIKEHYGETGELLEGPFIRQYDYEYKETVYNKASATVELGQHEGSAQVEISPPVWERPDDYGSTTIRIEPTKIVKDERYIYVDGGSNLLEGTSLRGRAILPGYVTSGFIGHTIVNPDGTFRIIFENPESDERIKNLEDYEITVETDLYNTVFATVIDAYGEDGEKMTGELVEKEGEVKKAIVRVKEKKE